MKNIVSYIVGLSICVFGLLPPIDFAITAPQENFPWIFLATAFAGFYLLFLKVNFIVKAIPIVGLINCFFSTAPILSFIAYFSLVACCYFYVLCTHVRNYTPIFKMLFCLWILNMVVFFMQFIGHDPLLNFSKNICYGIAGQHMQSASFIVILTAALIPRIKFPIFFTFLIAFLCHSLGAFLCASVGLISFVGRAINFKRFFRIFIVLFFIFCCLIFVYGKFEAYFDLSRGRLGVWVNTFNLSFNHPIIGYGIGTFKVLFPAIGGILKYSLPWKTAHNCWLQILFEMGWIGLGGAMFSFSYLIVNLIKLSNRAIFKKQSIACLGGLLMIGMNMMFHFPTRQLNCILIIIFFITYCERLVQNGIRQT